jgi:hypothetical protein
VPYRPLFMAIATLLLAGARKTPRDVKDFL